jgi:ankyrin repeat protein
MITPALSPQSAKPRSRLHWLRTLKIAVALIVVAGVCVLAVIALTWGNPICDAIEADDSARVEELLRNGRGDLLRGRHHWDSDTPLQYAARGGNAKIVATLIRSGALVNTMNEWCWTPLHYAVACEHVEVARLLLANGAYPNKRDRLNGSAPLHLAAHQGNRALVELLLAHGADPRLRTREYSELHLVDDDPQGALTPADVAQREGYEAIAQLLRKAAENKGE